MTNPHPQIEIPKDNAAIEASQRTAARIAGALAHEVNNPLQGVQTLIGILSRECRGADGHALHFEQVRSGLARIAQIIDIFAVAYENIPREPDAITPQHFLKMLSAAAFARQLTCTATEDSALDDRPFRCMVPETVRLIAEVFSQAADERTLHAEFSIDAERIALVCRRKDRGGDDGPWVAPTGTAAVSGVAVLLAELTQMAGGTAEFSYDDRSLTGIRLMLQDVMISR